jgi:hypothetical protein
MGSVRVLVFVFPDGTTRWVPVDSLEEGRWPTHIIEEWKAAHPEFANVDATTGCVELWMPADKVPA